MQLQPRERKGSNQLAPNKGSEQDGQVWGNDVRGIAWRRKEISEHVAEIKKKKS